MQFLRAFYLQSFHALPMSPINEVGFTNCFLFGPCTREHFLVEVLLLSLATLIAVLFIVGLCILCVYRSKICRLCWRLHDKRHLSETLLDGPELTDENICSTGVEDCRRMARLDAPFSQSMAVRNVALNPHANAALLAPYRGGPSTGSSATGVTLSSQPANRKQCSASVCVCTEKPMRPGKAIRSNASTSSIEDPSQLKENMDSSITDLSIYTVSENNLNFE